MHVLVLSTQRNARKGPERTGTLQQQAPGQNQGMFTLVNSGGDTTVICEAEPATPDRVPRPTLACLVQCQDSRPGGAAVTSN